MRVGESIQQSRPARWYYGWNIVGLTVIAQMAALGLALNCFSLFLPDWHRDLNVSVSTLTLSITLAALVTAFMSALAGWAADRFQARWLIGGGLMLLVLMHVLVGFATAGWQIVALYAVAAPGIVFASIPCQALVSRWFVRRRGTALGLSAFGIGAAGMIFPPFVVWMLHQIGWRLTWWVYAAFVAVIVIPILLSFIRDRPADRESSYSGVSDQIAVGPDLTVRDILRRPNFWVIGCAFVCVYCTFHAVIINLAPIVASYGLSLATASILLSAIGAVDLVAKLLVGMIADRVGNRIPLVAMGLIGAAGAAIMVVAPTTAGVIIGLLMVGLGGAIWTLLASATAAEFGRKAFGRAFGLICTFVPLCSIAPPVLAWTQERTGSYSIGLIGLGLISFVGGALALLLREARPVHADRAVPAAAAA